MYYIGLNKQKPGDQIIVEDIAKFENIINDFNSIIFDTGWSSRRDDTNIYNKIGWVYPKVYRDYYQNTTT